MIHAENLSMAYGSVQALTSASFDISQGEILGLLGPNGAGKTTTLKLLTTFLHPATGRIVVDGIDAAEDPIGVRRRIGYLPETAPLYVDMTVVDYLAFVGRARGLSGQALRRRREAVTTACGIERVYYRPIGHLSKGYRQRVGLAQALIHDPDVLLLDEPTSGLDPMQILGIRDLIKGLARTKTVLFSTHILQEIQAVADRVMIINEGRIIASGTPAELERRAMGTDRFALQVVGDGEKVRAALAAVPGVLAVEPVRAPEGRAAFRLTHSFDDASVASRVAEAVQRGGWTVERLSPDRFTLEEVFVSLIRQSESGKGGAS